MNCTTKILISDFHNQHSLVTREVATLLVEQATFTPCDKVEIDFSGIEFISRSFADQFHKEKVMLWENGKKEIIAINMHPDVWAMFKSVAKTQNEIQRGYQSFPLLEFQTRRSLKDYLQSIK